SKSQNSSSRLMLVLWPSITIERFKIDDFMELLPRFDLELLPTLISRRCDATPPALQQNLWQTTAEEQNEISEPRQIFWTIGQSKLPSERTEASHRGNVEASQQIQPRYRISKGEPGMKAAQHFYITTCAPRDASDPGRDCRPQPFGSTASPVMNRRICLAS